MAPWYRGLGRASELVAKYIHPRPEIVADVERFWRKHFGAADEGCWQSLLRRPHKISQAPAPRRDGSDVYVVGVHIRGTDKQDETGVRLSDALVIQTLAEILPQ